MMIEMMMRRRCSCSAPPVGPPIDSLCSVSSEDSSQVSSSFCLLTRASFNCSSGIMTKSRWAPPSSSCISGWKVSSSISIPTARCQNMTFKCWISELMPSYLTSVPVNGERSVLHEYSSCFSLRLINITSAVWIFYLCHIAGLFQKRNISPIFQVREATPWQTN